jgi:hypothetical protein
MQTAAGAFGGRVMMMVEEAGLEGPPLRVESLLTQQYRTFWATQAEEADTIDLCQEERDLTTGHSQTS